MPLSLMRRAESSSVPESHSLEYFTKHAHPEDCRQYYLCIGGIPREYGCPLGTVFNVGSGNGVDGECSDSDQGPGVQRLHGDQDFGPRTLANQGFDHRQQVQVMWRRDPGAATSPDKEQHPRNSGGSNKRPEAVARSGPDPLLLRYRRLWTDPGCGQRPETREPATEQPLRFSEPVAREQQPLRFSEAVSREEQPPGLVGSGASQTE